MSDEEHALLYKINGLQRGGENYASLKSKGDFEWLPHFPAPFQERP